MDIKAKLRPFYVAKMLYEQTDEDHYLKDMSKPIGVSEYKITSNLPENLSKQLPSVEDIQKRIKK